MIQDLKKYMTAYLVLQTNYSHLVYDQGKLIKQIDNSVLDIKYNDLPIPTKTVRSFNSYRLEKIDINTIEEQFLTIFNKEEKVSAAKVNYCWLVDRYLITLVEDTPTVTIKVFTEQEDRWLSSNVNNANFLADTWDSLWTSKILAACWITAQCLHNGSCDWDLTDTPITVDKLFKALYEYTDWVVELDRDRQAGEWEIVT